MSCVYIHVNKTNGKVYIGKTDRKPEARWDNGKGYKACPLFYRAILKYGWDGFEHTILLEDLTKEQASEFERMYIALYKSTNRKYGYNLMEGGGINCGVFGGQATAKKLKRPVCQYDVFGNFIKEYSGVNEAAKNLYGKKHDSGIVQVCNGKGGTAHGFVWRYRGDPFDKYNVKEKSQRTIVDKYSADGSFIKRYLSLTEAENETSAQHGDILRCCKGQRRTAGGYVWRYA